MHEYIIMCFDFFVFSYNITYSNNIFINTSSPKIIFLIFLWKYKHVSSWGQERIDGFDKHSSGLVIVDLKLHPSSGEQCETRVLCAQRTVGRRGNTVL